MKLNHTPHVLQTQAGNNYHDPVNRCVYEVYFTLPKAIQAQFKSDEAILTEQVTKVSGLDALQKLPAAGKQNFFGATVSFLNPVIDDTSADITIDFNLNLRNVTDNWVLKIFKAWGALSYDLQNGSRTLLADYVADNLRIAVANRDGTIWRSVNFKRIFITEITGIDDLDYTVNEPVKLSVKFKSDYWAEDFA